MSALLDIRGLTTRFSTPDGDVAAVSDVDLALAPGETVGVVGESGSGKSQLFLSVLGLLARNGRASGSARLGGEELIGMAPDRLRRVRGARIAMIFQDPMTSLNPVFTVGHQLIEPLVTHMKLGRREALEKAEGLLAEVYRAENLRCTSK